MAVYLEFGLSEMEDFVVMKSDTTLKEGMEIIYLNSTRYRECKGSIYYNCKLR